MAGLCDDLRPRLRRGDFLRTSRSGRRVDTRYFRVFVLHRTDLGPARLGITVTRKVGNAVRRNRIKRLVREWFRGSAREVGSCDLVVIVKRDFPMAVSSGFVSRELDQGLERIFSRPRGEVRSGC